MKVADSRVLSSRAWTNQEIKPCMYIRTNIESIPLWYSKNENDCPRMVTANGSPSLDSWRVELCKFERDICNFKAVCEYWISSTFGWWHHLTPDMIQLLKAWWWMCLYYFFLFFMQEHSTLFPHFVASCVHSFCFHTGEGALMARLG